MPPDITSWSIDNTASSDSGIAADTSHAYATVTVVTLTGTGFTGCLVTFGDATPGLVTIDSDTHITIEVRLTARSGRIRVTDSVGDFDQTSHIVVYYPQDWIQPDDQWGNSRAYLPAGRARTWNGPLGDHDTSPLLTGPDGSTGGGTPAENFINSRTDLDGGTAGDVVHWTSIQASYYVDTNRIFDDPNGIGQTPADLMPAVTPDAILYPPPVDLVYTEYDATNLDSEGQVYGTLAGKFRLAFQLYRQARDTFPDSSPPALPDVFSTTVELRRLLATDYSLGVSIGTAWLFPDDLAARTLLLSAPTVPTGSSPPATSTSREWNEETDGPPFTYTEGRVLATQEWNVADLDDGRSLGIVLTDGTYSAGAVIDDPPSGAYSRRVAITANYSHVTPWYTPPAVRYWSLTQPPLGRPPLAHRQRRDGVATAGPPLAHLQGGTGSLRPDLAHRQQTP